MMLKKKASTRSWKSQNKPSCKALIVTGCLAQRYKQEIVDEIPEVDAVIGTSKYDEIFDAVDQALKGSHFLDVDDLDGFHPYPASVF